MRTRTFLITLAVAMLPLTASAQETETKGPDLETTIQWIENMLKKNGTPKASDAIRTKGSSPSRTFGVSSFRTETGNITITGTMLIAHMEDERINRIEVWLPYNEVYLPPGTYTGAVEESLDIRDLISVTADGRYLSLETQERAVKVVILKNPGPLFRLHPEGTTKYTNSMRFRLKKKEHAKKLAKAFEHVKTLLQSGSKGSAHDKDLF